MGDSSCSACSRTASYNSFGRERGGGGGRVGEKKGRREEGVRYNQVTDERCSYIADERGRIKWQISGRKEGSTFAGAHGGVDILCGLHKLPECTTIFRCYKLTAKNKFQ